MENQDFLRFAEMTDKREFVSPYSKSASGFPRAIMSSDFSIMRPIVAAAVAAAPENDQADAPQPFKKT